MKEILHELEARRERARMGGGAARIDAQHKRGKLTCPNSSRPARTTSFARPPTFSNGWRFPMRDILSDLSDAMSDPDPVRRAQIQMKRPLPKRFYKEVSTDRTDEGHRILLDGRPVRTPAKNLLAVPSQAIAGRFIQSFKQYPASQRVRSMNLDQVMEQLQGGVSN